MIAKTGMARVGSRRDSCKFLFFLLNETGVVLPANQSTFSKHLSHGKLPKQTFERHRLRARTQKSLTPPFTCPGYTANCQRCPIEAEDDNMGRGEKRKQIGRSAPCTIAQNRFCGNSITFISNTCSHISWRARGGHFLATSMCLGYMPCQ